MRKLIITLLILVYMTGSAVAMGGRIYPLLKEDRVEMPGYRMKVVATAYTPFEEGMTSGTGLAFDGRPAVPYRTLAVDPRVIPLGSMVYIPNFGWYLAHDTGSAIKGQKIDLCLEEEQEMIQFGRRQMDILVVPPTEKYRMNW